METPHYLRFVRALTLVAGAGCSDTTTSTPDAAPDVSADTVISADVSVDTVTTPDVSLDVSADVTRDAQSDAALDAQRDVNTDAPGDVALDAPGDVSADVPRDVSPMSDAVADDGGTPPADGGGDVVADASPCPATAPTSGARCDTAGTSCRYDMAGGGFTSCTCLEMSGVKTWSCATAVPGPLPPPELLA